jgi:hypothetical protein
MARPAAAIVGRRRRHESQLARAAAPAPTATPATISKTWTTLGRGAQDHERCGAEAAAAT